MPLPMPWQCGRIDDEDLPPAPRMAVIRAGLGPQWHWSGNLELASREPRIAIVGTRQPGKESLDAVEALAQQLTFRDAVIVSGAAVGTDMTAHLAALSAGGSTIVCLPQGYDATSWSRWRPALRRSATAENLLLLSPFTPDQPITRQTPVIRNRLIAALAEVIVVGEALPSSGTHSCTRAARDLGIPIFFLAHREPGNTELALLHRSLENGGAVPFAVEEALGPELPAAIFSAAARWRRDHARQEKAQLKLF